MGEVNHACCNPDCPTCKVSHPAPPLIGVEESRRRNEIYAEKRSVWLNNLGLAPSIGRGPDDRA